MQGSASVFENTNTVDSGTGGVSVLSRGKFIMKDTSSVSRNVSSKYCGGVSIGSDSYFEMWGEASVSQNKAENSTTQGGGVYNKGIFTMYDNSSVSDNEAGSGGGVYVTGEGSIFTMEDNASVSLNRATANSDIRVGGGGVYVASGSLFEMKGSNTKIFGNTTASYGGGVYVTDEESIFRIYNGTVYGNDDRTDSNTASRDFASLCANNNAKIVTKPSYGGSSDNILFQAGSGYDYIGDNNKINIVNGEEVTP